LHGKVSAESHAAYRYGVMAKMREEPYLVKYISHEDVTTVLQRIPEEERSRLRDIFITDRHRGVRRLGTVVTRGRRDIELCAILPPRVSLGRYLGKDQRGLHFGAPSRGQWPPWAVRRFLLYDVLLHELGHLQLVLPKSKNWNRKYASERLAQDFADELRTRLWSKRFDHADPVHNAPQRDELETIYLWERLDKSQRFRLVDLALNAPYKEQPDLTSFGEINEMQFEFLTRALWLKA
jgi:hypothetical protein